MKMYDERLVDIEAIGKLIKERRIAWDITQTDLAFEANISQPTLSEIERGQMPNVSFEALMRVAFALNFDISDIRIVKFQPNKWWRDRA